MTDIKTLWETVLGEIEVGVSVANFGTWFRKTTIIKQEGGTVYLGVPNSFVKEWLLAKHHLSILKSLRNLVPEVKTVEYVIAKNNLNQDRPPKSGIPAAAQPATTNQLGLEGLYINKEDNLNPKYVFDAFIVGPFNELANAAAQVVVKNIGTAYNPLFVYGGTGLGKTHLIQAIGNAVKKNSPLKKIIYATSEQFVIDYVNSVQSNRAGLFKEKYRKYDVLIMDDIQFFSDKDKTQEELFHLFNHFYESNKQIVFSSDKPPKYIPNIEERLRSRFEGGMIADIAKPDLESRLAILQSKAAGYTFQPSGEVLEFIASVIKDNIRELEGTLNLVACQSQIKNRNLTNPEVKNLIKNNIKPVKVVSVDKIINVVADFYNIDEKALCEKTRKKEVVKPRQVLMYILREDFNSSFPYIGQKLGGRDHSTVIHAYDKIKHNIDDNPLLNKEIEQIRILLTSE